MTFEWIAVTTFTTLVILIVVVMWIPMREHFIEEGYKLALKRVLFEIDASRRWHPKAEVLSAREVKERILRLQKENDP